MTGAVVPSPAGEPSYRALFAALPSACLLLDTGLVILDSNQAFLEVTGRSRADLVGRHLLDAFPGNPAQGEPDAGWREIEASLHRATQRREPDRMPLVKYDVEDHPGSGRFRERWWSIVNQPLIDADGTVTALVNTVEDVTAAVREREQRSDHLLQRAETLEADLYARAREIQELTAAEAVAARRLQGLAFVALELASAETVEDLIDVVVLRGVDAIGCDSGGVAIRDDERQVTRLVITDTTREKQRMFQEHPLDMHLPSTFAAATGEAIFLGSMEEGLAWGPEMAQVYATSNRPAWASLPLTAGGRLLGSLTLSWDEPRVFTEAETELLAAFAAQCASALARIQVRDAERKAVISTRQMSEALQRSLLTEPPQPEHLEVAARYVPAAHDAYVGGDWYDAFVVPDGDTVLVIGDVAGHDRVATTAMAQVRNVLRGVAQSAIEPPAAMLTALDHAMQRLAVQALATAVLAKVEQTRDQVPHGLQTLRWSNAGHPPPLLINPDGRAELLHREPDLLLGIDADTDRSDHEQLLLPGSTVLLYTDGLVERRGESLTIGLEWLRDTASGLAQLSLDELCDTLLERMPALVEDDVALLAFRSTPPTPGSSPVDQDAAPRDSDLRLPPAAASTTYRATLVLSPDPAAVRRARAFVGHHCQVAGVDEGTVDTAVLLTSEIVTNAFIHGRSEARLGFSVTGSTTRIEVGDDNSRHPLRAERNDDALDGRGLDVLDLLSTMWGVDDEPRGKVVWFELTDPA